MGNAATRPSPNPDPGAGAGQPSPAAPRPPYAPPSTPPVGATSSARANQNDNVAYPEVYSTGIAYPQPARPDFDYPQTRAWAPSIAGHHVVSGIPPLPPVHDAPSHANPGAAVGASGSNDELIRDILIGIGREELADSPVAVDLMKDVLAQTDGDTIKAVDMMLEIMAGGDDGAPTGSSSFQPPPQPDGSGRGTQLYADGPPATTGQGLDESSADALSDQIYQDVLLKAGGDPNRAAFMMRELGLAAPRDPVPEPSAAAPQSFDRNVYGLPAETSSSQNATANPPASSSNADQGGNEIFQDLLRQYNGNRDEAIRMMAQLGLEFDASVPPSHQPQQMPIPSAPESPSLSFLSAPAMSNASSDSRPSVTTEGFPDEIPGARHILEPAFPSALPIGLSTVPERSSISPSAASSRPPTVAGAGTSAPPVAPLSVVRPPTRSYDNGQALLRTYQVLAEATGGFATSNHLGAGGFGAVFRGKFRDGTDIAVKKLDTTGLQGEREFQREIKILGRYQSPNVVKLLGYACDEAAYCLVYELMDGSLDMRLEQGSTPLPWQHRIDVAMQAAAGLAFLHRGTRFPLAHMDVKSANVLLRAAGATNGNSASSTMPPVAKIGDVGLAQLQNTVDGITMSGTMPRNAQLSGMLRAVRGAPAPAPHVSGVVSMNMSCVSNANNMASTLRGSNGYLDPVYIDTGRGGSANDVFAFGVVLLELITGRPAIYRPQGTGPSVMLANEIGAKWVGAAGARPVPPGSPQQEAIHQYAKSVADARAGEWPDWALDGLALCAVSCLIPDRTHRVKMDKLLLRLVELHVRAGGAVPQGVMQSCEACGITGAVLGITGGGA